MCRINLYLLRIRPMSTRSRESKLCASSFTCDLWLYLGIRHWCPAFRFGSRFRSGALAKSDLTVFNDKKLMEVDYHYYFSPTTDPASSTKFTTAFSSEFIDSNEGITWIPSIDLSARSSAPKSWWTLKYVLT